jgi:hypothetical protein
VSWSRHDRIERSDVDTGLTGILLTHLEMTSPQPPAAFTDFWDSAYRAFE